MDAPSETELIDVANKFFFFGVSSLAKALVFRSLAKQALVTRERILAAISGYYSLFHLAMAIMFLCPQMLNAKRRKEIFDVIEETEGLDPSERIKGFKRIDHTEAISFLKKCTSKGFNAKCAHLLEEAKELREYVNYGPRMHVKNGHPIFGDCDKIPELVDNVINQLDGCLLEGIKLLLNNCQFLGFSTLLALEYVEQFLDKPDLFYLKWCSQEMIEKSKIFLAEIFQQIK